MRTPSRGERRTRRILRLAHLWIGLALGVPLAVLGITGSVLVFEHELDALFTSSLRPAATGDGGATRPAAEIIAAARAATTDRSLAPSLLLFPKRPGDPAVVRLAPPGRVAPGPGIGGLETFVDPASLAVLGTREIGSGLLRQIFLLHANAMIRDRSGREAIGWLGVAMLALGITGLVLWWPRRDRIAAAFVIKRGARGLRLHRDLHGAAGIWAIGVFMIVSFSGVYLAFPQTVGGAISAVFPARDLRAAAAGVRVAPIPGAQPMDVDAAIATALAAAAAAGGSAGATVRSVGLPGRPEQPYRVAFTPAGRDPEAPAAMAFVDPWTRRVIELRDPRTYSTGETILAWQHALHAGAGLGWTWRLLVFLSGLLPILFAVTGCAMWLLKRRASRNAAFAARHGTASMLGE